MSKDRVKKDGPESEPEWHPYTVWQQRIRDAEVNENTEQNVTGSWRTDAVWQNLIKE